MANKHKFDQPVTLRRLSDGAEREVQNPVDFVNAKYAGFELPEGVDDPRTGGSDEGVAADSPTSPPADVTPPVAQPPETTRVQGTPPTQDAPVQRPPRQAPNA